MHKRPPASCMRWTSRRCRSSWRALTTFAGVPAPTGTIDLKAVGVNGLLDKLMAMGLVPEDQMMGARMMLGMFAKVVEGQPDTMTSNVEFKDKHLFVNGMQLQ